MKQLKEEQINKAELILEESSVQEKILLSQEETSFVNKVRQHLDCQDDRFAYKDFVHGWNLYKGGKMGKHDLYCQLVDILSCDHQDFLEEIKEFLRNFRACDCPLAE
uniref:Uncharacterized protein n=1 Tax=Manihot esculenta TaxID=3983 RepID=A0A2C9VK25_MANES